MRHQSVFQPLSAHLMALPALSTIEAWLEYQPRDPYAVRMLFGALCTLSAEPVAWVFGRQLLADGLEAATGEGDVRVRPYDHDHTVLELRSASGYALVVVRTQEIRTFLANSYEVVPSGTESPLINWDNTLTGLPEAQE